MNGKEDNLAKAENSSKVLPLDIEGSLVQRGLQTAHDVLIATKTKTWNEWCEQIQTAVQEQLKQIKELMQQYNQEQNAKSAAESLFKQKDEENERNNVDAYEQLRLNEEAIKRAGPAVEADKSPASSQENPAAPLEKLQERLTELQTEIKATEEQYKTYNNSLDKVDKDIAEIEQKMDGASGKEEAIKSIKDKIKNLEASFQNDADKINSLLLEGDKKSMAEARVLLDGLNAKNLQVASLKDMLEVTEGKKNMYNKAGTQVYTFKEAEFIIPAEQKIAKEGNNYFLLKKNEDLTSLSPERKEAAQKDFAKNEQQITGVKKLIGNHCELSMKAFDKEQQNIAKQIQSITMQASPNLAAVPDAPANPRKSIEKMPYPDEPDLKIGEESPGQDFENEDDFRPS